MATITVPAGFMADWDYYVARAGLDRVEQNELRAQVRADFAGLGAHISETAAVYRFCDATWGGLPTAELARGFCAVFRWYPEDDGLFNRLGSLLLGKLCAQVYGAVPWPKPPAE